MKPNAYSRTWFELFLHDAPAERTAGELAFLERQIPLPAFRRVLDVCCGSGRHALPLARTGRLVTGVDLDEAALAEARAAGVPGAELRHGDMRDLSGLGTGWDAVLCLWSSFGFFQAAANLAVLRDMAAALRPDGRLVLDLYNRAFYERAGGAARAGGRELRRGDVVVQESWRLKGDRLAVHLDYEGRGQDRFEWQVFTPDELKAIAGRVGLDARLACSRFEEGRPPSADEPRMQIVLVRRPA